MSRETEWTYAVNSYDRALKALASGILSEKGMEFFKSRLSEIEDRFPSQIKVLRGMKETPHDL